MEVDTSKLAIENESGRDIILRGLVGKVKVTVKGYESDLANFGSDNLELYVSVKKEDIGKNVQIKAKNIDNIEIVRISNDIVQAVGK